ncbi:MAG: hypothetical protein QOD13_3445, partial [Thermoleophilaceae bacterium]|nr:hypothetical protein [Thermoleophilaceae bacterium]
MGRDGTRGQDVTEEAGAPSVLEASLDAIITIDGDGRVVRFNRAAEQIFGFSREEAVGQQLAELVIPPDLSPAHTARLSKLAGGERPRMLDHRLAYRAVRKSGEQFPVELIVTRSCEEPPMFTGFVRDMSRLVQAEDRGTRTEELLATAEDLAHLGSWRLDLRSGDAFWSDGIYRIHGLDKSSFEPGVETYLQVIHEHDRHRVAKLLETVVETPEELLGREVNIDYRIVRPGGAVRELRARGRVEAGDDGEPRRWVGMAQDVSEQRLTARGLRAHYAVTQALRDWASFEEGVVGLLRRLGTALDVAAGSLWTAEPGRPLTCRAFWSAPGVGAGEFQEATRQRSYSVGEDLPGRAWQA